MTGPAHPNVQLRVASKLACDVYIKQQAWQAEELTKCPWHPRGRCGFRRHGTYERKSPAGLMVNRWYCARAHQTVSLLPDFAASRVTGTLQEIEDAVAEADVVQKRGDTCIGAAIHLRGDILAAGASRWLRRRYAWVMAAMTLLVGCEPDLMTSCELTLQNARAALGRNDVLVALRHVATQQLHYAPHPLGLRPARSTKNLPALGLQQTVGPDPPG